MQTRALLAVLVDFVRQRGAVHGGAEAVMEEEVGDAGEQANGLHTMHLGFGEQGLDEATARALAFGFGLDHDGAYLRKMRPVEVERAAAQEDAALRMRDVEVAEVITDFGVLAAQQCTVAGERVDQ